MRRFPPVWPHGLKRLHRRMKLSRPHQPTEENGRHSDAADSSQSSPTTGLLEMKYVIAALGLISFSSPAFAASCEKNFAVSGVPMVTAVSYKSWQELPKAKAPAVLQKLAQAVAAEGFSGIQINKALSSIDAHQETSGSGRIQTLRVVARQKGAGVRIDAVFNIQAGQIADKNVIREGICNIINGA